MIALTGNWPAYRQLIRMGAQVFLAYRIALALELVVRLLAVYLLKMVWTAVYDGRESLDGFALDTVVAYLTLANLQFWLVFPGLSWWIANQVRDGSIAVELARPVPYLQQMFMRQLGATLSLLPFIAVSLPFALVLGGLRPPASLEAGVLYLVSVALSFGVVTLMGIAMGLLAFWTVEIWGFLTMRYFIAQFLGGALVPLWFFPDWLRAIANILPFQCEAFIPMSIYFGQTTGPAALRGLAIQLFWLLVMGALVAVMWRRAHERLVVQGG